MGGSSGRCSRIGMDEHRVRVRLRSFAREPLSGLLLHSLVST
jgi:hypothetical protein